ncbi:MAG: hypothetical protein WKF59_11135 [Chitinophagaceae bacterium]
MQNAIKNTVNKPVLIFYKIAILFALDKHKEALLLLEMAIEKSPKMIKQLIELEPSLLQNPQVKVLLANNKNSRS